MDDTKLRPQTKNVRNRCTHIATAEGYTQITYDWHVQDQHIRSSVMEAVCPSGHKVRVATNDFLRGNRCRECYLHQRQEPMRAAAMSLAEASGLTDVRFETRQDLRGDKHSVMVAQCSRGHRVELCRADIRKELVHCRTCHDTMRFDRNLPTWMYLATSGDMRKFGITNQLERRARYHSSNGWTVVDTWYEDNGWEISEAENEIKKALVAAGLYGKHRDAGISYVTETFSAAEIPVTSVSELRAWADGILNPVW